ncbi:hypothetical protein SAMN05444161_0460 [Rhizobiales bacterium GAS191]|nr:hypothetical protein SAMN05444161_0460 [Rhizobiales bacterium GAS191]
MSDTTTFIPADGARVAARPRLGTRSVAAVSIAAVWLAAALAWPLSGQVVPWDSKNHFYPMFRFLGSAFEIGAFPSWNPFHFAGHPTAADPQSLLFTPTMALFAYLAPNASMYAFDAMVYVHLLIGGLAVGFLGLRRGWAAPAALLAAVMFMMGGSAAARLQHTGMIFSYSFLPLALLALEETFDRRSYRLAFGFGVAAGLMALGRDQIAYFGCLILIGAVAMRAFEYRRPLAWLKTHWLRLAIMAATGAVIIIVPVILTLQFLKSSNRPEIGYGLAVMGSLPPQSFATLLFANVFGTLDNSVDYWGPGPMTVADGSWTDRSVNYVFAGTLPAVLLLWHGLAGRRAAARGSRFFVIVAAIAVIYALGRFTPLFEPIFDLMPGVALYRRPADATFIINFAFAMLAGFLLDRFCSDGLPKLRVPGSRSPLLTGLAIICVAATLAISLELGIKAGRTGYALREILLGFSIAAAGVLVMLRASSPRARLVAAAAIAAITSGELVLRHAASAIDAEPASYYSAYGAMSPSEKAGLAVLKKAIAERKEEGARPRVEILGLQHGWQNVSMIEKIEDTVGYNALRISDYEALTGAGENAVDLHLRQFPGTFRGWRSRLANLLGLEFLVLSRPIEQLPNDYPRPDEVTQIYGGPGIYVYSLGNAAPRAYVANKLISVDQSAVIESGEMPDFDRSYEALIDEKSLKDLRGEYGLDEKGDPARGEAMVRIVSYKRNCVIIEADTTKPGILVLHDLFYPGWEATVDEQPVKVLKTNLLFRGVELPRGRHTIAFRFNPLSPHNLIEAARGILSGGGEDSEP